MRLVAVAMLGTEAIRSIMGFDSMPGMAVLPTCSMRSTLDPINRRSRNASTSNNCGQTGWYGTSWTLPLSNPSTVGVAAV
jgi:hypothetical protein